MILFLKISTDIVGKSGWLHLCVLHASGPTYQYSRILFGPSLEEASARDLQNGEGAYHSLTLKD
jgi:hypothetical protein